MNTTLSSKFMDHRSPDSSSNESYYCLSVEEMMTAETSPVMISSHPSFSSAATTTSSNTMTDNEGVERKRVVGRCRNCSYKFYIRGKRTGEFCSRDCETCFVLFNKSGNYCKNLKSVEEIRKSIFEFQNELDRQQQPQKDIAQPMPSAFPKMQEEERLDDSCQKQETQEKTRWALNPAAAFFSLSTKLTSPRRKAKPIPVAE